MSAPTCFSSRQLLRLRVALLDSASGGPDAGLSNGYVTSNPVSLQMTPQLETGDEFTVKNGSGETCAYYSVCDTVKRMDLVVTLCHLDAQLMGLMTGGTVAEDGTGAMGLMIPTQSDGCLAPVSVEWWTVAQDGSSQATISSAPIYWHFIIPKATFVFGAETFENGIASVVLNGKGYENPAITADGPFDDFPAELAGYWPDGPISSFAYWRETSVPAASCDYVEVTSAAS